MTPHFDVKMCQSGSHWTGALHEGTPPGLLADSKYQEPKQTRIEQETKCCHDIYKCCWAGGACPLIAGGAAHLVPVRTFRTPRDVTRVLSFQLIDGRGADNISLITS